MPGCIELAAAVPFHHSVNVLVLETYDRRSFKEEYCEISSKTILTARKTAGTTLCCSDMMARIHRNPRFLGKVLCVAMLEVPIAFSKYFHNHNWLLLKPLRILAYSV